MKIITKQILCSALFIGIFFCPVSGQNDTTALKKQKNEGPKKILRLFDSDELLEITLEFDQKHFLEKTAKTETFDGILKARLSETDSLDRKITLKYRGESRYERCGYPPLEINFKKTVYLDSDSGKVKKIKLVHQCQRGATYEEYIKREYLVYKLYSVLTDTSFRVRLLKINYIDSKGVRKPVTSFGFFIEPKSLVAQRTNNVVIKSMNLTQKNMAPAAIDRMAIFNYMVSNWDWSVPGQHNVDILKSMTFEGSGLGIPVPFDFDLTGIVNAEYAIPPPEMGIESNRIRVFSGICRNREVFQKELMMFLDKKDEFYSVINNYPYLSNASKKDILNFLDQFFYQLEKPRTLNFLIDLFLDKCKKL